MHRPLRHKKALADHRGEFWATIKIPKLLGCYKISNYGRVKRIRHIHKGRACMAKIISPILCKVDGKFRVAIRGNNYQIARLMYDAFIGLKDSQSVYYKDNNPYNLNLENLAIGKRKALNNPVKGNIRRSNEAAKQKPLTHEININTGDKETKIKRVNSMKHYGYILSSSKNGVYIFKLLPKEGDTVKVTIEGSSIKVNSFVVESKDGAKYYLKGVDPMNFFLADELEIIKQS